MAGWKIVFQPEAVVEHSHDRSILYEYRRTYICHRRLFQLFGIQTIPSLPTAIRHIARGSLQDAGYILKGDSRADLKAAQLLRLPFLTFASVWGQYSGARDERRREPAAVRGV